MRIQIRNPNIEVPTSVPRGGTRRRQAVWLSMDEVCIDLRSIFHEVIHADLHVLGQQTFAKGPGLEFQSLFEGHLCPLQDRLLNEGVDLTAEVTDIDLRQVLTEREEVPWE